MSNQWGPGEPPSSRAQFWIVLICMAVVLVFIYLCASGKLPTNPDLNPKPTPSVTSTERGVTRR